MRHFKRLFGPLTEQIRWSPSDIFSRLAGASNPVLKPKCGLNHYESIRKMRFIQILQPPWRRAKTECPGRFVTRLFLDSLVKERLGTGNITEFRNVFKLEKK